MSYLYKLVTTENVEINYDVFKKKELIECLATVRDIYFSLKQENKQLKERMEYLERSNDRREDIIIEQRKEISDLEDNWDELKKYLHNVDVVVDYSENYDGHFINYDELIDKMQKLEQGSDSNEI